MPSTRCTYPQVISRHFVSFRVVKFRFSAVHSDSATGSIPSSSTQGSSVQRRSDHRSYVKIPVEISILDCEERVLAVDAFELVRPARRETDA